MSPLKDLIRRARLTVEHHGWSTLLIRFLTAPLRPLGLEQGVRKALRRRAKRRLVVRWYRREGRPVTIVVPTYGPPDVTFRAVRSLLKTTDSARTRIVVVDDASAPEHRERLRALDNIELVLADENAGYAASVNRGIERARSGDDVVVMNNDVIAHRHWLPLLQHAAYASDDVGIAGPRLLYPDGRIQSAGSYRNLAAPEWFDHRYRFRAADFEPASVRADALAVTGACMYLRRDLIEAIGRFDSDYPMGYEDVDYCLRAWDAGRSTVYEPRATLTHLESPTRGTEVRDRERSSQRRFWERWGAWFDERPVRTPEGALRVIYVTEGTGVGGGHRDVFEHLDRLRDRGHEAVLYSLEGPPDWYPLGAPVRSFASYAELEAALAQEDAIKVATWWRTARSVWRASVRRGRAVYFVQDIETSYYPGRDAYSEESRAKVLASYREEFRFMTISRWNRERLAELNLEAELVPPGIDLDTFRQLDGVDRRDDMLLALGRSNPLKNLPLTVEAWRLVEPRPELCMFGIEPELGAQYGARYVEAPTDAEVNRLFNEASALVQTSVHEGFCLPPLEAMAAGAPVVCTDAHGNRDFCRHGENCLIVEPEPRAVAAALDRVRSDPDLRARLVAGGLETVGEYAWERRIDQLERFLGRVADERPEHSGAVPGRRVETS